MESFGTLLKVIMVGDSNVGKSCIVLRYTQHTYTESYINTVGLDFKNRVISIGSKIYKVQLWDTAGQERYRSIRKGYYRGAKGIILVYDITNPESFVSLKKWIQDITEVFDAWEKPPLLVIGNKTDLECERKVCPFVGQAVSEAHGARFAEVSAKTGEGVENAVHMFIEDIITRALTTSHASVDSAEKSVLLEEDTQPQETCDC